MNFKISKKYLEARIKIQTYKVWQNFQLLPNTVIDDDMSMARSHTRAILNPVSRFVELCRDPKGFLMPKYLPKLMKHMCKILAEHANTSHVT